MDDQHRPGQILNHVPHYPTRQRIRKLGMGSIDNYEENFEDLFWDNPPENTMALTPANIVNLGKRLGAANIRLETFDGTNNIKDFFQDLDLYFQQTAITSADDKLNALIDHTTGDARAYYHTLTPPVTYASLKSALEECFGLSHQEKCKFKSRFYAAKQLLGESFKQYVGRMQEMARQIDIPKAEVVAVSMSGTWAELRPHLTMAGPDSVQALLKLAVVANEGLVAEANPQFEALNAISQQLQKFERNMTALHTAAPSDSHGNQCSGRSQQRRQRNNGPQFQQAWNRKNTGSSNINTNSNNGQRTPNRSPARQTCGRCLNNRCQGNLCRAWGPTCNKCGKNNHFAKACRTRVTFQQRKGESPVSSKRGRPQAQKLARSHNHNNNGRRKNDIKTNV